jgi:gamma-glutamyltranspeptidase
VTSSVNTYFGSHVVSPSSGIVLNNQMDDFATPGKRNYFGLKPSEENYIKPFKKPLSSMSPTMVFRTTDSESSSNTVGDLILIIGASGGPKIITAVLQVIINHLMMGMPLFDSMAYPRLHDQLIYHGSAVTTTERAVLLQGPTLMVAGRTKDALVRRGHALLDVDYAGTVQAISIDLETNELSAVCDLRKGGRPDGY